MTDYKENPEDGDLLPKLEIEYGEVKEGRRAWVTLFIVFLSNCILGINWIAFSVLYLYFTDHFSSTKATSGWIVSIQVGITQTFGVFVSPAVSIFGCRVVSVFGSLLMAFSTFVSSFTPNIWFLFISYGLIPGIGLSMLYLSLAVIIQKQFHRNRALACGISILGLSVGNMVGPIVVEYFVIEYGWRGALIMLAGISLHITVFALLFPPLHLEYKRNETPEKEQKLSSFPQENKIKRKQKGGYISHLLDFSVFKKVEFFLFCCAYMMLMLNTSTFWNHLVSRAVFYGAEQTVCAVLVSVVGFGAIISRIICSFIANLKCANYLLMFSIGLFIGAAAAFALTFTCDFYVMMAICFMFGTHLGCSVTVVTVSAVYLLGVNKIARSQAFLNFFYGIGAWISVPFSGWVFDVTGNYNLPFYITSSMELFGAILGFTSYLITVTNCTKSSLGKDDKHFIGSMDIYVEDSDEDSTDSN